MTQKRPIKIGQVTVTDRKTETVNCQIRLGLDYWSINILQGVLDNVLNIKLHNKAEIS